MEQFGIDLDTPWEKLSEEQQIVLYGNGRINFSIFFTKEILDYVTKI